MEEYKLELQPKRDERWVTAIIYPAILSLLTVFPIALFGTYVSEAWMMRIVGFIAGWAILGFWRNFVKGWRRNKAERELMQQLKESFERTRGQRAKWVQN